MARLEVKHVSGLHLALAENCSSRILEGPFRAVISDVKKCEKPAYPYMKDPPLITQANVYNISNRVMLNCSVTVWREVSNVKFRMKNYVWNNNKWKLIYVMNDIGCRGVLLYHLITYIGIKYDREKCTFLKGHYQYDSFDVNAVMHILATKVEYGKMMWRCEMFIPRLGSFYCLEFYTANEPA